MGLDDYLAMSREYASKYRVDHWELFAANYIKGIVSARHTQPLNEIAPPDENQLAVGSLEREYLEENREIEELEDYTDSDFDEFDEEMNEEEWDGENNQQKKQTLSKDQNSETSSISSNESTSCDSTMSFSD